MIEIKFRVWDITSSPRMIQWAELKKFQCEIVFMQTRETFIMQYTGIKDKNGVEIYEGDVVTGFFGYEKTGVVTWLEKRCGFFVVAKCVATDIINRNPFYSAFKMNSCKLEIIGNIHENPELL